MKFKNLLKKLAKAKTAVKIGAAVASTIFTGTVSKTLKDVGVYIDLTEKVADDIRQAHEDVKDK